MPDGQFGQSYYNLVIAQILGEISFLGTDQYFFRHYKDTKDDNVQLRLICGSVFTAFIVSLILVLATEAILTLDIKTVTLVVLVCAISMSRLLQLYLRITENGKLFSYFTIISAIIFPLCVVVGTLLGAELVMPLIHGFFLLQYGAPLLLVLIYLRAWRSLLNLRGGYFIPSYRSLKYGLPFLVSTGIENTTNNLEKMFLASMANVTILDDLMLASRIGGAVTSVQNAVTSYWVPRFFNLFTESVGALILGMRRMYLVVLGIVIPIISAAYIFTLFPIISLGKTEHFWIFLFLYIVRNSLIFLSYVTYTGIDVLKMPKYHVYVSLMSGFSMAVIVFFNQGLGFVPLINLFILLPAFITYFCRTVFSNMLLDLKWYLRTEILILLILLCF